MADPPQKPTTGLIETRRAALLAVMHPAVRLGFLDAAAGRDINHFDILRRIERETPSGALRRLRWDDNSLFADSHGDRAALAEFRYEEGRLLYLDLGLKCKAWGHPDFPPAAIRKWIETLEPLGGENG